MKRYRNLPPIGTKMLLVSNYLKNGSQLSCFTSVPCIVQIVNGSEASDQEKDQIVYPEQLRPIEGWLGKYFMSRYGEENKKT